MKILLNFACILFLLTSCEGDPGPPGPPGFDGADGGLIVSGAFEIEIDFTAANDYQLIEAYGFEVLPSDVTLVYILWETIDGQDIWRLIPQNVQFPDGILTYNYDFTQTDVRIFLDGTTNFEALDPSFTQNQVFRIVVIPADNVDGLDITNLETVINANNIQGFPLK